MIRPSRQTTSLTAVMVLAMAGCEIDSYFDPSKTGRFEYTPTTIPILDRIDVVEREHDPWAQATAVTPDDLLPSDLTYRLVPGDVITVTVLELIAPGQMYADTSLIDAAGYFRLPSPLGDIRAAGLTVQEFQDELSRIIDERVLRHPVVNVMVEQGSGFTYTIYGAVAGTGIYNLRSADHRLLDALALAGGVPLGTRRIYIIRQVPLSEETIFQPARRETETPVEPPVDVEDLIRQLEEPSTPPRRQEPPAVDDLPRSPQEPDTTTPQRPPIDIDEIIDGLPKPPAKAPDETPDDPQDPGEADPGDLGPLAAPAAFHQQIGPPIDIDDLEPVRVPPPPAPPPLTQPPLTQPPLSQPARGQPPMFPPDPDRSATFIYDQQRDEWVPVHTRGPGPPEPGAGVTTPQQEPLFLERIIEIPYQKLKEGDSSYNVVLRPRDRIYVREPQTGVIYIEGEISRPGVYSMPANGKVTLSRLVAAAGGPGPLAWPTRVDLTRIVSDNREATIRLNLAAIRQRTQPDLYLRPDDHIIIGTQFWALPLAVFRNGLRGTYGYGFLLDRNFGNDVFGPPPRSGL